MRTKIIILGVNGMLGNNLFKYFNSKKEFNTIGILRDKERIKLNDYFLNKKNIFIIKNIFNNDLKETFISFNADIIINCIGIIKQNPESLNPYNSISINSLFPHYLNDLCKEINAKLIHISTDCVFSGSKGNYLESDLPDAKDLYGRSKLLGEVDDNESITLRGSYIGEELNNNRGLLSWFLSQKNQVKGFKNAIFSGVTASEFARIIEKFVIPNKKLNGIYHVSSDPIDKFSLLKIIKEIYCKDIEIIDDYQLSIDRSLNSYKFREETGYQPLEWEESIKNMRQFGVDNHE